TFVRMWGTPGNIPGQFNFPQGVAVDSLGNLYVTDQGNVRVQKFLSPGFVLDDADPDDADGINNSITYDALPAGTYVVTELPVTNWTLTDISCEGNSNTPVINLLTGELSIALGTGEDVTCTFRNQ